MHQTQRGQSPSVHALDTWAREGETQRFLGTGLSGCGQGEVCVCVLGQGPHGQCPTVCHPLPLSDNSVPMMGAP